METKETLDSLYAIRAGLSLIANNIDSFYNAKLQWLKAVYKVADDPVFDNWTKYYVYINKPSQVQEVPTDEMIAKQGKEINYYKGWNLSSSMFDSNWGLNDYSIGYALLFLKGYDNYYEFEKSKEFKRILEVLDYADFERYINSDILDKNPIDLEAAKKKNPKDEYQDDTDADWINRVIEEEISDRLKDFRDSNFPKNRVWHKEYDNGVSEKSRIIRFFTFGHWITTDGFKKYLDEREKFYTYQTTGLIHKKPKYPVYLEIVQAVKAKLPELIERVKTADKNYFDENNENWLVPTCSRIYKALVANYSKILDLRDWKYLDLIIYAIETHRAENIKEALNFVDSEMRMQRMAALIENATNEICNTISMSMSALQNTMVDCCNSINARITAVGGELSAKMDRAISATEMSNALLAKANVSSEKLLNQVTSIKEILR